jgi:hypothetical protein
MIVLMIEVANISETSVSFYQITRPNNPEARYLHTRHCKNLKSHQAMNYLHPNPASINAVTAAHFLSSPFIISHLDAI